MSEAWAVICAGGSGSRFSETDDKLLASISGIPVLVRTIQAFLDSPRIHGIVVVASAQNLPRYQTLLQGHCPNRNIHFTVGGSSRRASVYQGLMMLPLSAALVAIHDAARPLISPHTIEQALNSVTSDVPGVVVALPVVDTIKQVQTHSTIVQQTVDRSQLWRAQTPQVFLKSAILQAHQQVAAEIEATDDAQLLELAGLGPVTLIPGHDSNLKITGPNDIWLAEALLSHQAQHSE